MVDLAVHERANEVAPAGAAPIDDASRELALRREMHRTIARVTDDLEKFGFNRAVARIREFTNMVADFSSPGQSAMAVRHEALTTIVRLIGPIMPHLAEELWQRLGNATLLVEQAWPVADPEMLIAERVTLGVQVNGKLRGTLELLKDTPEADVRAAALALPNVAKAVAEKPPRSVIVVANRIVNVVL